MAFLMAIRPFIARAMAPNVVLVVRYPISNVLLNVVRSFFDLAYLQTVGCQRVEDKTASFLAVPLTAILCYSSRLGWACISRVGCCTFPTLQKSASKLQLCRKSLMAKL